MKTVLKLCLVLFLSHTAFAQRGGFHGGFGRGGGFGFAHGGFGRPGFGRFPGWVGVHPRPFAPGHGFGFRAHFRTPLYFTYRSSFRYPYWYPLFWGGWGFYEYPAYPAYAPPYYPPTPNIIIVSPPPQGPTVVSYREPTARPEVREYGAPTPGGPEPIYFLLPLKDKTVDSGVAYWVQGNTLHYITTTGVRKQVALGEIDRKLAAKLNEGKAIPLILPGP